jgi:hypothetical protein
MSAWMMGWYTNDGKGPKQGYECPKHGKIGKDIVIIQAVNGSPESEILCHRCFVQWANKFKVKAIK